MRLKRLLALLTVFVLLAAIAEAGTWYVYTPNGKTLNLRSPVNNAVIGNIPYGTLLETDDQLSTETAAFVTWGGKSGFVKWQFLVKDPPAPKNGQKTAAQPRPVTTPAPQALLPVDGEGAVTIQALGAYLEYYGSKTKAGQYSAIAYDTPVKLKVTADVGKNQKIDYWVIDGVRYDFKSHVPTSFTLDKAADNMIIEAVVKGAVSQTLISPEAIQQIRTGEQLLVKTIHAKLCHVRADLKGAGGWIKSFDFTNDYINRATKKAELGGQVTVDVKAVIPKGKKIAYWKFDDTRLDFDKNVTEMLVHTLNGSKTYEPVFGTTATNPPTREQPPATQYYTVTCHGCTFTGGGYTNATSGTVPAGTQIKATKSYSGEVGFWRVNGSDLGKKATPKVGMGSEFHYTRTTSISRTINKNTVIECLMIIN